jgi:hypothetical protein
MTAVDAPARVLILHVPDCPLVDRLLSDVTACMTEAALTEPIRLRVGDYPSPTLVIDGIDVATGEPVAGQPRCRMDLPSRAQIRAALDTPRRT